MELERWWLFEQFLRLSYVVLVYHPLLHSILPGPAVEDVRNSLLTISMHNRMGKPAGVLRHLDLDHNCLDATQSAICETKSSNGWKLNKKREYQKFCHT